MKRYAPDACDPGLNECADGDYVLYEEANAEAADLSADLQKRTEEVESLCIKVQFLEARIRGYEAMVNLTPSEAMDAYLRTRGL